MLEAACAASFVSVLVVGCRSSRTAAEPPPVVAPALEYGARHFVGSVLSGPSPQLAVPAETDPAQALAVRCVLTYHERLPRFELPPLGTQARMIGAMQGETAILPNPVFTTRVQYAGVEIAAQIIEQLEAASGTRSLVLHEYDGALFSGTSVVFAARSVDTLKLAIDTEAQRRVALSFSRGEGDAIDFGIVIDQLVKAPDDEVEDSPAAQLAPDLDPYLTERENRVLQREYLLLQHPPVPDSGPVLILVPSPFPGDEGAGFAMQLEVEAAPSEEPAASLHAAVVATMLEDLVREHELALESARRLGMAELEERQIAEALRNLRLDRLQRKTLVFLTTTTGAPLAEDLVMIVADENLKLYAETVISAAEASNELMDADGGLGWILERGAFQFLTTSLSEEQISSSHFGLLLKHAGEAGNFPAVIEDALAISRSRSEFVQRLIDENRIFLEDHNIAARVRAYDWLLSMDAAPPGYDPLGDSDSRREALSNDRRRREAEKAAESAAERQGAKS